MKPQRPWLRSWHGLILAVLSAAVATAADPLETVGRVAGEVTRTRAETVRLQTEWASQRQLMEAMVHALEERATSIESKRDNLKERTAQEREELAALETKNQSTAGDLQQAEARLKLFDEKLLRLRQALPPRLSAALELPYRSLAAASLPLGERLQLTMTVLNRCVQFNRVISWGEEVLTLAGESTPRSLEVIYWGLSHGYALDRTADRVWLGSPGPQGWQWEPRPDAAKSVAALLAVAKDKAEPEFVTVPAQLRHTGAETAHP
jgi:Skp family chaperone for outer membrane proteins